MTSTVDSKQSKLGLTRMIRKVIKEKIIVTKRMKPQKHHHQNRTILRHHIKGSIRANSKEDFHQGRGLSELRQELLEEQVILSIKDMDIIPHLIIPTLSQ